MAESLILCQFTFVKSTIETITLDKCELESFWLLGYSVESYSDTKAPELDSVIITNRGL